VRELAKLKYDGAVSRESINTLKAIDAYLDPSRPKDFATALRDSFGEAGNALAQMANALQDYTQKQAELAAMQKALAEDKGISAADRVSRETQLAKASAQVQISGYASIAAAAKRLFKEHSKGYKAMEAAEKAFRVFEMAMSAESVVKQLLGITTVTGATLAAEQTRQTAIVEGVEIQLTADQIKGISAAKVGIATQGQGDPYSAWARMAAMAAMMAALGFAVSGVGGSGGGGDAYTKPVAGTGTVLGAEGEPSKSIGNAIELLAANSRIELPLTQQMLMQLRGVRDGIEGLSSVVARDPNLRGVNASAFNFNGKTELLDSGIMFNPLQTIGSILDQGIQGLGFSLLKSKGQGAFVLPSELGGELKGQMNGVVRQLVGSVATAAQTLGLDDPGMFDRIRALMPSLGDTTAVRKQTGLAGGGILSLEGLSGKDAAAELEALFSSMGDQIAQAAMPSLAVFQKAGEGMYETVMRVSTGVEKANYALEQFGIGAVRYTDIVNKSGDVAAEIVRQSVMQLERTAQGGLTGVGRILEVFTGSYDELIDLYQVLVDVRGAMRSVGAQAMDLSAMMVRGAGGIDKLQGGLQDYFDGFFSAEEQNAARAARLAEEFGRIGVVVPASKDAFRALVASLDTSTDAGGLLFGQLMSLSAEFAAVADAAEASAAAQVEAVTSAAKAAADAWRSVADGIRSDLERLRAETQNLIDPALRYARGLAQLDRDVVQALSGDTGDIEAARRVGASATGFLQASERTSTTRVDYLRDRALTEAKLGAVLAQAEEQASIQQVIADASAKQILELQSINANLVDFARAVLASGGRLPGFADGGLHAGGLRLVGERGWEIEATGPSRIWNQAQIAAALSGASACDLRPWERESGAGPARETHEDRVERYLSELLAETCRGNEEGRTGDAAIASLVGTLSRQVDRLSDGGDALRVRTADDDLQASPAPRKLVA
jgi:hypothetical protein